MTKIGHLDRGRGAEEGLVGRLHPRPRHLLGEQEAVRDARAGRDVFAACG